MKKQDTQCLISSVDFSGKPDMDMNAMELNIIRDTNIKKLGRLDIIDLMYDAYKLGFAKALLVGERM